MSFPRYPAYRDSGVAWLGEVPEHWRMSRIRYEACFVTGATPPSGTDAFYGEEHPWANISDLGPRVISTTANTLSQLGVTHCALSPIPAGSLLYSFKLSLGQVSFAGVPMYTNEAIAAFLPSSSFDLSWAFYALPLMLWHAAETNIYGAKLLNQDRIRGARILLPPLPEQHAIATFLDHETARIDALVAEQERLVMLLREKRQAVISHAVTKGLDPNVPRKDSGVAWLGEVPEHWDIQRIRRIATCKSGVGFPDRYQGEANNELPFFKVGDLARADLDGAMRTPQHTITRTTANELGAHVFPPGTIVLAKVGAAIALRRYRWLPRDACIDNNMMAVRLTETACREFLLYLLPLIDLSTTVNPGAVPSINESQIGDLAVTVPPLPEQHAIVALLDAETARLDTLVAEAERAISLLRERRSALISAAVTGQIDVRGCTPGEAA